MTRLTLPQILESIGVNVQWMLRGELFTLPEGAYDDVGGLEVTSIAGFDLDVVRGAVAARPNGSALLIPPLYPTRALPDRLREEVRPFNLHEHLVLMVAATLTGSEKLVALLPRGSFSGRSSLGFRSRVAEMSDIPWVVEFTNASGMFRDEHHSMEYSILVLEPRNDRAPLTRFVKLDWSDGSQISELRFLRRGQGNTDHGFIVRERLTTDRLWTWDAFTPLLEAQKNDLTNAGSVVRLGEVVTFLPTVTRTLEANRIQAFDPQFHLPQLIEGRMLLPEGRILEEPRYAVDQAGTLQVGDIVIRGIVGPELVLNPVRIGEGTPPMVPAESVIAMRPIGTLDDFDVQLIVRFLGSRAAKPFLRAGAVRIHLTREVLSQLPVPIADAPLKQSLRELTESAVEVAKWQHESNIALDEIFSFASIKEARPKLLSVGRRLHQRIRVATAIEDPAVRIRTSLPHPIAFRWRTVEATASDLEGYLHVLEAAEVAVCFLAQLSMIAAKDFGVELGAARQLAEKLMSRGHGTTMGDWVAIFRELRTRKEFRRVETDSSFYELIKSVPVDSPEEQALARLVERRNDIAHQRGPRGGEVSRQFESAKEELQRFLLSIEFLSDYPLRFVERSRRDVLSGEMTLHVRDLMGDHPLVPMSEKRFKAFDVEESLYWVDRAGRHYLLRPYLSRRECPTCHTASTFFLDSIARDGRSSQLKTLEHGHSLMTDDVDAFRRVGFLQD